MSKTICCRMCEQERASLVCTRCLRANLKVFRRRCAEARAHNDAQAGRVETSLARRALRRDEVLFRLANVRREADYTRSLTSDVSKAVDALRDKVARRRAAYERAKREAQEVSAAEMSQLKTYSRARRKVWRDTFDRIVDRRRLLVRDTLSLYRLAPIPAPVTTRADLTDSRVAGYHIGGTAVPSILQFKEQSMPAAIAAMELIARLVYMLAQYLGIRLPHRIQLPSSARPTTSLTHGTRHETYSLRHDRDDISAFAMACAMLVVDVHHLASMQQLSLDAEEHDLGRMLLSIGKAPALGQVSDEAARTPVREQDRPKTLSVRRLAARIVEEHHVNEQWETVNLASLSNSGELERSGSELVAGPHLVEDNNQLSVKGHMPIVPAGVASTSTAG